VNTTTSDNPALAQLQEQLRLMQMEMISTTSFHVHQSLKQEIEILKYKILNIRQPIPAIIDTEPSPLWKKITASLAPPLLRDTSPLSVREYRIAELLQQQKSYKSIGRMLRIDKNAIHSHVYRIKKKLGLTTTAEIITYMDNISKSKNT